MFFTQVFRSVLLILALLLAACAAPQAPNADEQRVAAIPLICKDKATCDVYWSRAQLWLATNGAWRVRIANDTQIETFSGVSDYERKTAYRLLLEKKLDGSARIWINPFCRLGGACDPNPTRAAAQFKLFIESEK